MSVILRGASGRKGKLAVDALVKICQDASHLILTICETHNPEDFAVREGCVYFDGIAYKVDSCRLVLSLRRREPPREMFWRWLAQRLLYIVTSLRNKSGRQRAC